MPTILCEFEGMDSVKVKVRCENVSPMQIWGAIRMLSLFADDMWRAQNAMQHQTEKASAITVAQSIVDLSKMRRS